MDSRPTMITATDFVSEGYAAKVAAGECEVTDAYFVCLVNDITAPSYGGGFKVSLVNHHETRFVHANCEFPVEWLQPQATDAPADSAEAGRGETVDYQGMWFSVAKQLAELRVDYDELFRELEEAPPQSLIETQQAELDALREQVRVLTGENTKLQQQLVKAHEENDLLSNALDELGDLYESGQP